MADDQAVQKFGDYDLVERIAVGGMAEVWRARAYGLAGFEKTLVIKKILDSLARDDEFVRLFVDEARIAVLLQHHNIVQVFDLGMVDGTLYMAMEYVHGLDLSRLTKRLDGKPFPLPLALFIFSEVLKALRFAHQRKGEDGAPLALVHCDISPHNILVSHAGEVKITDFGISRAAFQASQLHDTVRGKYAYMSPEQIENHALDHRSDLFSLGIVMWEVLTGRRLFKAKQREETLKRVKRAEVPSPREYREDISADLERILLKALSRDPDHRFADAAAMLEELGLLMVREGHRVTNHDVAAFLASVGAEGTVERVVRAAQHTLVVLSAEALPDDAGSDAPLGASMADALVRAGAQIWEEGDRSVLAIWLAEPDLTAACRKAAEGARSLGDWADEHGAHVSIGMAPGRTRIYDDTRRPGRGWELNGPFYLSRWLMNLAIQRDEVLMTGVVAGHLPEEARTWVGRVETEPGRYLRLAALT